VTVILRRMAVALACVAAACSAHEPRPHTAPATSPLARIEAERDAAQRQLWTLEHQRFRRAEDTAFFDQGAREAWQFVDSHLLRSTGFVAPVRDYSYATMWDIGSMLAAMYCAHALGLIDDRMYTARMRPMLRTLATLNLYDNEIFGRSYDARTGAMVRRQRTNERVVGWSATDIGRLLVWLRIVATDPALAREATAVANRLNFRRLVKDGYIWGDNLDEHGRAVEYPEGRIGYEQYAAEGFALWGHRAEKALDVMANATPITVGGQTLVADLRRWDRLTNEPFLLMGLELGWNREVESLARRMLLAQEARYRQTGRLTIAGEDAIAEPPHYFYYYCVYANGKQFGIDVQDRRAAVDGPRWVSAKSAFALHALMPTRYSRAALAQLRAAHDAGGWSSGVYEATGASTATPNINTSAVLLTAALVQRFGEPVLVHAQRGPHSHAAERATP
jgi:hypothetical protein